jgi:hypothetical protein
MEEHRLSPRKYTRPRPKLTAEEVVDYLDWLMENADGITTTAMALHMQAAELAIRTRATDAQNKATQHTLVEQGIIEQPT